MFTLLVFIAGIVVGTIFHALFSKWGNKAKSVATEVVNDVHAEADKLTGHKNN